MIFWAEITYSYYRIKIFPHSNHNLKKIELTKRKNINLLIFLGFFKLEKLEKCIKKIIRDF